MPARAGYRMHMTDLAAVYSMRINYCSASLFSKTRARITAQRTFCP